MCRWSARKPIWKCTYCVRLLTNAWEIKPKTIANRFWLACANIYLRYIYVSVRLTQNSLGLSPSRPIRSISACLLSILTIARAKAVLRIHFMRHFNAFGFFFCVCRSGGIFIRIKWLRNFYFDFKLCFIAVLIIFISFSCLYSNAISLLAHAFFFFQFVAVLR